MRRFIYDIMKRIVLFLTVALAALAFSCQKPVVEPVVYLTSSPLVTVPTEGDVVSITFTSNAAWTAKTDQSWITVSPASGEAGENITIKASALKNDTNDSREATVTITAGSLLSEVVVIQAQLDAMNLATTEFTVDAAGGTVEIPVSANVDYEISVPDAIDWVQVVSTRGLVDSKITLQVDGTQIYATDEYGYPTLDENDIVRTAKLTIKGAGQEKQVTIGQKGFIPYFEYTGEWAALQGSFYEGMPVVFPQEGGTFVINVHTNIDWRAYFVYYDATINEGFYVMENGWAKLSFDKAAGTITIVMDPNDTFFSRDDYLYAVGMFDGVDDGNFRGLGWFQQAGKPSEGAAAEFVP